MNEITGFVFAIVIAGLGFYVLYLVVRCAVADGIRDARGDADTDVASESTAAPDETLGV